MGKPVKVKVVPYGDGWTPANEMLCPMFREEGMEAIGDNLWCEGAGASTACECLRNINSAEKTIVCAYHLSEQEDIEYCALMEASTECDVLPQGETHGDPERLDTCVCGYNRFVKCHRGPHLGLYCASCGLHFKWIPQEVKDDPNFVLTWGIHKGKTIGMVPTEYLQWGANGGVKGSMQTRFHLALVNRGFLFLFSVFKIYSEMPKELPNDFVPFLDLRELWNMKHKNASKGSFDWWIKKALPRMKSDYRMFFLDVIGCHPKRLRIKYIPSGVTPS